MINVLRSVLEAKVHHLAKKLCGLIRFSCQLVQMMVDENLLEQ